MIMINDGGLNNLSNYLIFYIVGGLENILFQDRIWFEFSWKVDLDIVSNSLGNAHANGFDDCAISKFWLAVTSISHSTGTVIIFFSSPNPKL